MTRTTDSDWKPPGTDALSTATQLRQSFLVNESAIRQALREAKLPADFLDSWYRKMDRLVDLLSRTHEDPQP